MKLLLLALPAATLAVAFPAAAAPVDFVRDVQPILQKSCYGCHGEKSQMASLRLDARAAALRGGLSGKTIVPGKSAESSLYLRVAGVGEQARMPMGMKTLRLEQIAVIKQWIDEGAVWPDRAAGAASAEVKKHWAFQPPQRAGVPKASQPAWVRNPIDAFVLARLDKEAMKPSSAADKTTLLRRLSLDLIGLPPTPADVAAFLADKSPTAYEKQVDRLLRSPHYGERWARHWLDAARYADSDGFEKDKQRQVWFFRDWVINAFNRDLPYNQFITEQLAGDLLPNATQDQMVATGFLRNSMINEEGGIDPEQFRMESMFDRMDAIGKSMLGLTINCAQCHTHKYDPILHEDYYKLFAFLNNANEANAAVYTPDEQRQRAGIFRQIREIEGEMQQQSPDWVERMARWEAQAKANQPDWVPLEIAAEDISTGGQKYLPMGDASMLAQGYAPTKHRVKLLAKSKLPRITAVRLELINDPNLPLGGPGRSVKGTGALTEFAMEVGEGPKPEAVKFARATADVNPAERELEPMFYDKSTRRRVTGPVDYAIDGNTDTAWGIDMGPGRTNVPRKAVFTLTKPVENAADSSLTIYLQQNHGGWNSDDNMNHNLGRFRLSVTSAENAEADPLPANVRAILAADAARRTPAQQQAVFSYWRTTVPEWSKENARIEELWRQHPAGSSQLILSERQGEMRTTRLLTRGDFLKPANPVKPGVPAFLNQLPPDAGATRLTLARWMTDRQAPTTARAFVNRVWQSYFGTGIVATSEDFGRQSEAPSHQDLLDWLAVELMEPSAKGVTPWSAKHLHRLIVTSNTYRQSSAVTPEALAKDPYNRMLARGARLRVEGEIVRDITLAASGLLSPRIGGPNVYPPAPDFLFQPPTSYGPKQWHEEHGEDRYRRALYTHRYRSVPYPMLQNFDTPNGDASCVRRTRSNTPLQALTSLNEPLFMEAARALARKTVTEGGTSEAAQLDFAFRRVVARAPSAAEKSELLALLEKQTQRFGASVDKAWEMAAPNSWERLPLPPRATIGQLAAWTTVSRVLLNLDEAITKE
ncbi:MAG: DUF1549 domain-containing protein [Acidobacteria bacterium]|nr:DUF1549 domain-containing protein [Acidobacteriota bacterium]